MVYCIIFVKKDCDNRYNQISVNWPIYFSSMFLMLNSMINIDSVDYMLALMSILIDNVYAFSDRLSTFPLTEKSTCRTSLNDSVLLAKWLLSNAPKNMRQEMVWFLKLQLLQTDHGRLIFGYVITTHEYFSCDKMSYRCFKIRLKPLFRLFSNFKFNIVHIKY